MKDINNICLDNKHKKIYTLCRNYPICHKLYNEMQHFQQNITFNN